MFSLKFDLSNLLLGILHLTGLILDVRVHGACLEILMVTFLLAYEKVLAFILYSAFKAELWPARIGVEFTWNINDRLLQSEVDSREVASVLSKDTEETTWFRYKGTINELIKI